MITIKTLAKKLEDDLNARVSLLSGYTPNTEYRFFIAVEEGEYKKPVRELNTTTKYINGVVKVRGDNKSGVTADTVVANISAVYEFVVPDISKYISVEGEQRYFKDVVRSLVDNTLEVSTEQDLKDENGTPFYVGTTYSIANTGMVDIRGGVGESLTMTVYVSYTMIATGISSQDIKVFLVEDGEEDERIYATRVDLVRSSIQESNIPSGAGSAPSAKALTSATTLSINLSKPLRSTKYDNILKRYIVSGVSALFKIKIVVPPEDDSETQKTYTMCFADASIAAEGTLAASCNATLVENMDIQEV